MATKNDTIELATKRIGTRVYSIRWYRLIHALRCLVAGDVAPLLQAQIAATDSGRSGQQRVTGMDSPHEDDRQFSELYDIFVTALQEGRSNDLLKATKTLMMQVAFSVPDIDVEDGEKIESLAIQAYLSKRLGQKPVGCDAGMHMRKSFVDYMCGGIGWSQVALDESGRPVIQYLDALDVIHDLSTDMPQDLHWYAHVCRKPGYRWVQMYGEKAFATELKKGDWLERPVTLTYYYDIDGETGNYAVFKGEFPSESDLVDSGPNPFYTIIDNVRKPFLNADPCVFMVLPSVRYPVGILQNMVPHQMAIWASERYMRDVLERGAPFHEVQKGALDAKSLAAFKDGTLGSIIEVQVQNGITTHEAMDVPQSVSIYSQYNRDEIQSASGVDPFATGDADQNFNFASEVNAVASRADLTAHHMTKDHCNHWQRTLKKYLATAALYDDAPVELNIDGTRMQFDEKMPINMFLRPDAEILVSEDSTRYMSQAERFQRATAVLNVVAPFASQFPNGPSKALEGVLRAAGIKDIAGWLKPPDSPMMGADMGAASADAGASMQ